MADATRRVGIVSGGSRGIGAAVCARLAARGDDVHLLYRNRDDAAGAVVEAVQADGGRCRAWRCDVRDEDAVHRTVAAITGLTGRVDTLVTSAGITRDELLLTARLDAWRDVLDTHLTGTFLLSRAVLGTMLDHRGGVIVTVGSPSAHRPGPGQCAYAAAKAGVEGFTRALAAEVGHKGIRVVCVNPGGVRTEMTAPVADRLGSLPAQPDDIAGVVAFLTSDDAHHVNGEVITVDGGASARRPR